MLIHSDYGSIGPFRWINTSAVPAEPLLGGSTFVLWGGCAIRRGPDEDCFSVPLELQVYVHGRRYEYGSPARSSGLTPSPG